LNSSQTVLEAIDLSHYVTSSEGQLTILDHLNLKVLAGETLAIIGASGSGKSTLLGLLAGMESASAGKVLIQGHDLADLDEDARAAIRSQYLRFVFQNFQLMPTLNALENVMLPLELAGREHAEAIAREALARVGLASRLMHRPRQLSGGEQQRVAIARAYAPRPAILLADEPTGNLDVSTGHRIMDLLMGLNAEYQTTLVLVTHDLKLANLCQRQLRLEHGQLQEAAV
jgi:putative ABC transport system ATP-binding protein